MTRNSIPCTTSFRSVKCNKMRSACTVINTFAWGLVQSVRAASTPTGIDCRYEHEHNMSSPLAGRLPKFLENWQQLTLDPWVLQVVKGYHIEFTTTPQQHCVPPKIHTSEEKCSQIAREVRELLSKGAIEETQLEPGSFISQIFLAEKKGGGYRPVVNLKELNQFVKPEHFKMEGLHLLPSLMQQGDYMVKLDLKDAYLQVPIHPDHHQFLQF